MSQGMKNIEGKILEALEQHGKSFEKLTRARLNDIRESGPEAVKGAGIWGDGYACGAAAANIVARMIVQLAALGVRDFDYDWIVATAQRAAYEEATEVEMKEKPRR